MWAIRGKYARVRSSTRLAHPLLPAIPKPGDVRMTDYFIKRADRDRRSLRRWKPKRDWNIHGKMQAMWPYALVNRTWLGEVLHFMWRRPTSPRGCTGIMRLLWPIQSERRKMYADFIQITALNTVSERRLRKTNAKFRDFSFENLRFLRLNVCCTSSFLRGNAKIPDFRCPKLTMLEIRGRSASPQSDCLYGLPHEWRALFKRIVVRQKSRCLDETPVLLSLRSA